MGDHDLWARGRTAAGYGVVRLVLSGKQRMVHRIALTAHLGEPLPSDMVVDHLCRVRHCVTAAHLELVTNETNIARGEWAPSASAKFRGTCRQGHVVDGRYCTICRKEQRDETWRLVREACARLGMTQEEFVAQYGVSRAVLADLLSA